ncbi:MULTISPECIES: hypothetical protein [Exiguobacterium]|uniref:Uncharacterized protein n=1 Tax=Exiguobacterium sp. (strain ATCC BAA-1283 / AT1b) TaxID=360911 RepID=C4L5E6_EXISA|nr:hypothetical protein [Exiguobacterium sp. AT1b]ACQ71731.1 hypothetical protein EAT1b_2817 [Exiguobacterium sp. AT1b]
MKNSIYLEKESNRLCIGASRIQLKMIHLPDSIHELEQMICSESIQTLYISTYRMKDRDLLEPQAISDIRTQWNESFRTHIVLSNEADLDDFQDGYCFFAELFHDPLKNKILILYQAH